MALAFFFWAAFLFASLVSYSHLDPSFNRVVSQGHQMHNLAGIVGSYVAGLLVDLFGVAAWSWPLLSLHLAVLCLTDRVSMAWWRWLGLCLVALTLMTWGAHPGFASWLRAGDVVGGGFFGSLLYGISQTLLRPLGAGLAWGFLFLGGLQLASGISWSAALKRLRSQAVDAASKHKERSERRERRNERAGTPEAERPAPRPAVIRPDAEQIEELPSVKAFKGRGMPPAPECGMPMVTPAPAGALAALLDRLPPEPEEDVDAAAAVPSAAALAARERSDVIGAAAGPREEPPASEPSLPADDDLFSFPGAAPASAGADPEWPTPVDIPEPLPEPEFAFDDGGAADAEAAGPVADDPAEDFAFDEAPAQPQAPPPARVPVCRKPPSLPGLNLLSPVPASAAVLDRERLKTMAQNLVACLADFGVKGEVVAIKPGPVVTMFEVKPAPGTKISRIAGLADDLALAMRALAVRIDAIPGSDVVGVEIPNETRETVYLREIFESDAFAKSAAKLTLALGKDIQGRPFATDLARMPHLLVAGATGAGKSVCLNTILLSFLYKARPDELKLLLIDPKRIELSVYSKLPHLVHPVVTEMPMAKSALEWAVAEMDRRYQAMALLGVRNIEGYNQKLPQADLKARPELAALAPMPYMVIIIDELADLMMTAGKEAEMSIVRLAQLARAAGIHLILATQRPSVDVVTGLIKANFPSRISFQVTSKHDSRTILDMVGSEKLLGRGDSLYKPSGGKVMRVHGAFVDEEEIERVVEHWRKQCPQDFAVDLEQWQSEQSEEAVEGEAGAMDSDPMYREAVEFVASQGKASISLLQRRFRIGFNRAARFIEQMELDGMLGPQEGAKPRAVIKGRE